MSLSKLLNSGIQVGTPTTIAHHLHITYALD